MIELKDIQGKVILSTEINEGAKRKFELMKEDSITLPFSLESPIEIGLGSFVEISEGIFEVVDTQRPTRNTTNGGYDYELRLDAYYWKWKNKIFKFTPETGGQEASWSLTASLDAQLGVFIRNLKALGYTYQGQDFEFSIDSTVENKAVSMTYNNTNMIDALSAMAESWDCEWWVTDNIIHFGRCEYGTAVDFEIGVNVAEMTASESKSSYATRLYVFGSTRNLPSNYRPLDESIVVSGVVQKRLMLPEGTPYLDAYENMSEEEAIEEVVVIEDIYPRTQGKIASVTTYEDSVENEDGTTTTETFYRFTDNSINFSNDYILEGEELKVKFERGSLNGMEFGLAFNPNGVAEKLEDGSWNPEAQLYEIVANEDYGRKLPDTTLYPKVGDKYILIGWDSTKIADLGLVSKAERELQTEGEKILAKRKIDPNTYSCKMFPDYMYGLDDEGNQDSYFARTFIVGDRVNLINDAYFKDGRQSRIIGYEYYLDFPFDSPTYIVGETTAYSRLGELEDKVESLQLGGVTYTQQGGSGVYIIGTNDSTSPTNRNVYSALRSDKMYLRKDKSDRTSHALSVGGKLTAETELKIGKEFVSGLLGTGAHIDEEGRAELHSLFIRQFLEVPELRYNRVTVRMGDSITSCASGIIESVTPLSDMEGTLTLKLEDGEFGTLAVDDIVMQIFSDMENSENNATETSDDGIGNRKIKGFATVMFRVIDVTGDKNEIITYRLRETDDDFTVSPHPYAMGSFAQRGNFTNTERQTLIYEGICPKPYTRYMTGVNNWEFTFEMIGMQMGYLGNLSIYGYELSGYSAYLNNIYYTGFIFELTPQQKAEISAYNVMLSEYVGSIRVDSEGNVIAGEYTPLNVTADGENVVTGEENVVTGDVLLQTRIQAFKGESELAYVSGTPEDGQFTAVISASGCTAVVSNGVVSITEVTNFEYCSVRIETLCEGKITVYNTYQVKVIKDGKGIKEIIEWYQVSDDKDNAPEHPQTEDNDYGWKTTAPAMTEEAKYLWNYEETRWTDDSVTYTEPAVIGAKGETGATTPVLSVSHKAISRNSLGAFDPATVIVSAHRGDEADEVYMTAYGRYTDVDGVEHVAFLDKTDEAVSQWNVELKKWSLTQDEHNITSVTFRSYSELTTDYNAPYLAEDGITFVQQGEVGEAGPMPRNAGKYDGSTPYYYNDEYRDFVWKSNGMVWMREGRGVTVGDTEGAVTGEEPSETGDTQYWKVADRMALTAIDTALVDNANIAGFMFKGGRMVSQDMEENTNAMPDAKLILDGTTGYFKCVDADVDGDINVGVMSYKVKKDGGSLEGYGMAYGEGAYILPSLEDGEVVEILAYAEQISRTAIEFSFTVGESGTFDYSTGEPVDYIVKGQEGSVWATKETVVNPEPNTVIMFMGRGFKELNVTRTAWIVGGSYGISGQSVSVVVDSALDAESEYPVQNKAIVAELDKYAKLESDNTFSGDNTFTGVNNFTGSLKVNGQPIVYNSAGYWKLEGDLLVTGGVTSYSSDTAFTPSTVTDAVEVDWTTIIKDEDGRLAINPDIDLGGGGIENVYALTIKNSAGTSVLSYDPSSSAASLTLTKAMVGLGNVENTALSTWTGSTNITTLGTITSGTWKGSAIANAYLANSAITINGTSTSLGGSVNLYIGTTKAQTSSATQNLTGIGYINSSVKFSYDGDDTNTVRFQTGHTVVFGGVANYANQVYYFRPMYGSGSETTASLYIQKASASASDPTYTNLHYFDHLGHAYHQRSLTVGTTITAGGAVLPSTTESYAIGSSSLLWSNLYTKKATIDGISLYQSQDGVLYLDGDLVVAGGVTSYGDTSVTSSTIMDALLYDSDTLGINSDGELYVKAATGGGLDESELATYLTNNTFVNKVTTSGSGNAVTAASISGNTLTLTKGATYLTTTTGDARYLLLSGGTMTGAATLTDNDSYIASSTGGGILGVGTSTKFSGAFSTKTTVVGSVYYPSVLRSSSNDLYHYREDKATKYIILDALNYTDYFKNYYNSTTSRTANTVLAAPNGSAGAATFRALVAADIPNLAASKITSGVLAVAQGGTGQSTLNAAANSLINSLTTGSSTPVDADYYISQIVGGGTTTTTYHRRPVSALYAYIKGKAEGTWGISISGNAATATDATKFGGYSMRNDATWKADTIDARIQYTIDATSLSTSYFYPIIFPATPKDLYVCMYSTTGSASSTYNQNKLEFTFRGQGWTDTPIGLTVHNYNCYSSSETTIGCIGMGQDAGQRCVWVRGGLTYYIIANQTPSLKTASYTSGNQIFTYGSAFYGGSNTKVTIYWTPQSTSGLGAMYHSAGLVLGGNILPSTTASYTLGSYDKAYTWLDVNCISSGATSNNLWLCGGTLADIGVVIARSGSNTATGELCRFTDKGMVWASGVVGRIATTGQELQFKYNNADATSLVLNSTAFKPFISATSKLMLGRYDSLWNGLYLGTSTSSACNLQGVNFCDTSGYGIGRLSSSATNLGLYSVGSLYLRGGCTKGASGAMTVSSTGVIIDSSGNMLVTGGVTSYSTSDKRLKENIRGFSAGERLMSLGGVYEFEYSKEEVERNKKNEGTHIGLLYQNVKGTEMESMCLEREDGYGALNYLDTNFINLLAGVGMEHETRLKRLERENEELRKEIETLKNK